jgi:glycosyltransferase involved in cell wall biosynthesis
MIVRNEAHVIEETLASAAAHIGYWVIVDTGSTDDTIGTVQRFFDAQRIPGEIHVRDWRNFGANRTQALELARGKGDYMWVIDADDVVVGSLDLTMLTADSYSLRYGTELVYWRKQIFRDGVPWSFEGVMHEYPVCQVEHTEARLEGDYYVASRRLGDRNRTRGKYERDATLLLAELDLNPEDARSVFYLAQSYFDAHDYPLALEQYRRRIGLGGWDEEVFFALLRRALCLELVGEPWPVVVDAFLACWEARPGRAEPLYELARRYRDRGEYNLAHLFAARAVEAPFPSEEILFVAADVYDWRSLDELAIASYYIGDYARSAELCTRLLSEAKLPLTERERVRENLRFAEDKLR